MYPEVVFYAIPFFILAIICEIAVLRYAPRAGTQNKRGYTLKDTVTSLAMGTGSQVVKIIGAGSLVTIVYHWVAQYSFYNTIPANVWTILLCFVLDDFAYYWFHRVSHERRWFWASHIIHHSSRFYNLSTALRQTWTGRLTFTFIFSLPLLLIGFPVDMLLFVAGVNLIYQFWIHTETIDRCGPFEWLFNTPSHHRVHHATNPKYLDANYAGVFIIWDKLFGTFVAEDPLEKPNYGIIKNIETYNPFIVAFHEWHTIIKDVMGASSLRHALGYLFGPPGWSPDGSRMTSKMIKEEAEKNEAKALID